MKSCSYQTAGKNKTIIKTAVGVRETKIFSVDTALQWIRFEEDGKERFITFKKTGVKGLQSLRLMEGQKKKGLKYWKLARLFHKNSRTSFSIF